LLHVDQMLIVGELVRDDGEIGRQVNCSGIGRRTYACGILTHRASINVQSLQPGETELVIGRQECDPGIGVKCEILTRKSGEYRSELSCRRIEQEGALGCVQDDMVRGRVSQRPTD